MFLSELIAMPAEARQGNAFFGVEVDGYTTEVAYSLSGIGILAVADPVNILDVDVLDVVLLYATLGTPVTLEIPMDFEGEPANVLALAANLVVQVALLPPVDGNPTAWECYYARVAAYAEAWFAQGISSLSLLPIVPLCAGLLGDDIDAVADRLAQAPGAGAMLSARLAPDFLHECLEEVRAAMGVDPAELRRALSLAKEGLALASH